MKSIKIKINLVMFLMLGTALGFGYLAFQHNQKMEASQEQLSFSLMMRDELKSLKPPSVEGLKKLKSYKNSIRHEEREYALSNLIQAYNANNPRLFQSRIVEFEKVERKFFKYSQWLIAKYKKEVQFYLILATLFPLAGLLGLIYYFNYGILSPLQSLSKRMMEFLIDQYSFRFSSPPNNEIGNIERTFNSLAQKVLNNMDELLALDRAKSEFVSIASHELRTPLTSIKGSLGLLSSGILGQLDAESREMVLVAEQETDRLVRLINDMLDLAKIESRSITLKKDWTDLGELMQKTVQGLHGFATAAGVKIEIVCEKDNLEVFIDADRIQQVLTNLFSNAIKYSPKNGVVILNVSVMHEGSLELSISDQGQGISEDNQKLIFEKFRQATDSHNHLVKGTGLGLAISKALIEEHSGHIGVRSTPGQGATFYFTLLEWRENIALSPYKKAA